MENNCSEVIRKTSFFTILYFYCNIQCSNVDDQAELEGGVNGMISLKILEQYGLNCTSVLTIW